MGRKQLGSSSPKETPTLLTRELLPKPRVPCVAGQRAGDSKGREPTPFSVSQGSPTNEIEAMGDPSKREEPGLPW